MEFFLDIISFLFSLLFLFSILVAFYIPGAVLLRRFKIDFIVNLALSLGLGIVLWAWQGMIFGLLNIRWATYMYLILFFAIWFSKRNKFKFPKINSSILLLALIIGIGSLLQLLETWFVGVRSENGLSFCCNFVRDEILYLAIVNEVTKGILPQEPGLSGFVLKNYHYWSHIVVGELVRTFKLPLFETTMRFIPLLLSVLLGLQAVTFSKLLKMSNSFTYWLLFFLYFGADSVYLMILIFTGQFSFDYSIIHPSPSFLTNYPFAFSIVIFFAGLNLFTYWTIKRDKLLPFLFAFVLGSVIGFKANTVGLALGGFVCVAFYLFIRKNYQLILPTIFAILLSMLQYLPVISGPGGLFFTGFWRSQDWVVQPFFKLSNLENARQTYIAHNNVLRTLQYDLMFFGFYILAFGTKLLAFAQSKKSLSLIPTEVNIFLITSIAISFVTGFFFQQSPGGANSIFFIIGAYFIASIYVALACSYWIKKLPHVAAIIVILLIISLTIPESIKDAVNRINLIRGNNVYKIIKSEMSALDYLKNNTPQKSIVLVYPYQGINRDAPYVAVYANRRMFLAGQDNELISHGVDSPEREESVKRIFESDMPDLVKTELIENKINYIYTTKNHIPHHDSDFLKTVYQNENTIILKVVNK